MKPTLAVVSISGGKDSTATAIRAIKRMGRENVRLVMADTGHEHELTITYALEYLPDVLGVPVDVVKADFTQRIANKRIYVETKWPGKGVPDEIVQRALSVLRLTGVPFLDLCLWKGRFPSRKAQFCTQELKRIPLDNYLLERMADGYEVENWRGIRRDESDSRKDAVTREFVAEGFCIVHPISHWNAQQVVDYVLRHGIELNPLYSQGMKRIGCMPCINAGKDELLAISQRFPQYIDIIREWERLISLASKIGCTTFFGDAAIRSPVALPGWEYDAEEGVWIEPDAEIYERMRVDNRVRWAETAWGGRQSDFIRSEPVLGCSSLYGLCE